MVSGGRVKRHSSINVGSKRLTRLSEWICHHHPRQWQRASLLLWIWIWIIIANLLVDITAMKCARLLRARYDRELAYEIWYRSQRGRGIRQWVPLSNSSWSKGLLELGWGTAGYLEFLLSSDSHTSITQNQIELLLLLLMSTPADCAECRVQSASVNIIHCTLLWSQHRKVNYCNVNRSSMLLIVLCSSV